MMGHHTSPWQYLHRCFIVFTQLRTTVRLFSLIVWSVSTVPRQDLRKIFFQEVKPDMTERASTVADGFNKS